MGAFPSRCPKEVAVFTQLENVERMLRIQPDGKPPWVTNSKIADATQRALAKRRTSQSSRVSLGLSIGLWDSKEPAAHCSTTDGQGGGCRPRKQWRQCAGDRCLATDKAISKVDCSCFLFNEILCQDTVLKSHGPGNRVEQFGSFVTAEPQSAAGRSNKPSVKPSSAQEGDIWKIHEVSNRSRAFSCDHRLLLGSPHLQGSAYLLSLSPTQVGSL